MKTGLLTLAALGLASAANAQLLQYGFEDEDKLPGELAFENWANFEFSRYDIRSTESFEGKYALRVSTDGTSQTWERVVALKRIPVEPMKSYRVSMMAAGNASFNLAILEGDFYQDIALQTPSGALTYTVSLESDEYTRVSRMFWSPSYEDMCSKYSNETYPELLKEYFLRMAFTGDGAFLVDNISIQESSIAGIVYNGDALAVDFGYATNAADLAREQGGVALIDPACVSLTVDGEAVTPESVELHTDGMLYIFLSEETAALNGENQVAVSFQNTLGLTYTTDNAPNSFESPKCAVLSFEGEAAYYDDAFSASSFAWTEAELVSSDPEDESFELDPSLNTFTFTFNKNVLCEFDGDPAVATLTGGAIEEVLVLKMTEEAGPTLTFTRPDGAAELPKGMYTITLENVYNEKGVPHTAYDPISFEVGKVVVAEITYEEKAICTFPEAAANFIPEGWRVLSDGAERLPGENFGSGGRTFDCAAPQKKGIYTRANGGEGLVEGPLTEVPAGEYEVHFLIGGWSNNSSVTIQLLKESGDVVFEKTTNTEVAVENIRGNADFKFPVLTENITFDGSPVKLLVKLNTEGFNGMFVGGFEVYKVTATDGEKADSELLLGNCWANTGDNHAPEAGSGWRIYAGGVIKVPGNDYNYNGARIFNLGYKNLTKAFYNGMSGNAASDYIIYGEGVAYETEDADGNPTTIEEPVLHLSAGKIQVTYYCANWKTDLQHQTFDIIDKETGEVVYTRTDNITPNGGGDRNKNIEGQKVQFSYYVPADGDYMLKFYTDGEGFVGNLKIETVGSMAVQYKNMLKDVVNEAKAELEQAMSSDDYDGETRQALAQGVEDYTNPDLHTVKQYNDAMAQLTKLTKAMTARRGNINGYASGLESLNNAITEATGTKNEQLESFVVATMLAGRYAEVSAKELDDEELAEAVSNFNNVGSLLKNMANDIVPNMLAKQAVTLANMIISIDENAQDQEWVVATGNLLEDDQELVANLKKLYAAKLYAKLATEDVFTVTRFDEVLELEVTETDSLAMGAMIQNPMFYTTACSEKPLSGTPANAQSFPGWNITINQNSIQADWGWRGPNNYGNVFNEIHPITDAAVCTAWGTSDIDVNQTVALMPVGIYTAIMGVGDGTSKSEENLSRAYAKTEAMEAALEAEVLNDGGGRALQSYTLMNVATDVEGNLGSLTIGAKLMSRGDFSQCDNANLYMTAKLPGFDYAAAAKALMDEIAAGIELQERDDQPAQSYYYDLQGRRVNDAQNVCIRIDRYADGYTVVRKVVVK